MAKDQFSFRSQWLKSWFPTEEYYAEKTTAEPIDGPTQCRRFFFFNNKWRLNHYGYDTVPTNGRKCAKIHGTTICQNALYGFSMPQMIYGVIFHTK